MSQSKTPKSFYSGFEEVVSRLISLILSMVFFSIYITAKDAKVIILDLPKMLVFLGIFWLTYEVVSAILFFVFCQFSKNKLEEMEESKLKPTKVENLSSSAFGDYNVDKNNTDK